MLRKDRPMVAVVGAGYWGRNLVRNFYQLGALKSVADDNPATVQTMLESHPGVEAAGSYQDILNDPEIAGVVLATPAVTHYQLTRLALKAGKHVFAEKPLALARNEGRELVELAAERGLILMVDHLLQRHPAYAKLRQLATEGVFGRIRHIYSRRLSFGKIRTEEDAWWSFAPHDISMILGLMNRSPLSVAAEGEYWLNSHLADRVEARLDFGGGASARISVGWLHPVKEHRLAVIGEEKMAVFDDTLDWAEKLIIYDHKIEWPGQRPEAVKAAGRPITLENGEPLAAQARDFLAAMEGRVKPLTDGREGLSVLEVLQAGAESMKVGGRIQTLEPMDKKEYFLHPTAVVDPGARIGAGCRIWHFSHVLGETELGENCNLGQNVVVGPRVKVGRGVKIQNNVSVYEGVTLEDEVFCGPSMVFTNVYNPRAGIVRRDEYRPTLVRRGATIGANATVVCGRTLGAWSFVGAGAVVLQDVPDHGLVVGNPARQIGWVCRCGQKLTEELSCPDCGLTYETTDAGLKER